MALLISSTPRILRVDEASRVETMLVLLPSSLIRAKAVSALKDSALPSVQASTLIIIMWREGGREMLLCHVTRPRYQRHHDDG